MLSNIIHGLKAAIAEGVTSRDTNDAPASSPSFDSHPPKDSRDSPPAPKTTPDIIDLSSPTKSPKPFEREERRPKASTHRLSKRTVSEDEKRLTGDFIIPEDAVLIPDPSTWMKEARNMNSKPGASRGFRPLDTITDASRTPHRKPMTYGKHDRPRPSLIGQTRGPGETAYSELQQSKRGKAHTSPGRHLQSRDEECQWPGAPPSGKRRKIEHVISLDDDEDEEMVESRPGTTTPTRTYNEKPLSARSSQSRLSIGSGSAGPEFKPSPVTSEFRETECFIKPSQKKPRRPSSTKRQGPRPTSPFGNAPVSISRQSILRDFRQGESNEQAAEYEQQGGTGRSITSRYFPDARINESTKEQSQATRPFASSADLRTQHRPVPKQADQIEDSDSADELAFSPSLGKKQTQSPSKAKKVANGVKRHEHGKDGDAWPLSSARTHDCHETGSMMKDGHATLVLRGDPKGWRVQKYSADGYETIMLIDSQRVNNVHADDIGRIRLEGPRDANWNIIIFDLQFLNSSDFLTFRDTHAVRLTTNGKIRIRSADHMRRLFETPLKPRNNKTSAAESSSDTVQTVKSHPTLSKPAERLLLDGMWRSDKENEDSSTPRTGTATTSLTRSSRLRSSVPTHIFDDGPEISEVSKYSIETGLGRPWTKALEYGEGRQRAIVHFDDLPRLDEEEYLNDSLIDFYMIYLFKKLNVPADKVYFFNTYFFTRLTEKAGRKSIDYKAVERWTSKIDIFTYDYIIVPINESQAHWYLAIICNVSNIPRKPVIENFDEPHSRAQAQSESSVNPAATSDVEESTTLSSIADSQPPVEAEQVHSQQEEDSDLFEEARLSLIDRDAGDAQSSIRADEADPVSTEANEPVEVLQTATDPKPTIQEQLIQSATLAKNKAKRKTLPKRDPHQPVVVVLDSLGGIARSGAVRTLKDWIAAEGKSKRGMEAVIKENGYYPKSSQIPMQNNWTDCGVYLLGYVEKFFQNPDEFMHKLLTGSMSAKDDWPELKPSEMRHKMRDIIFDCYKQQEEARKAKKRANKELTKSRVSPDSTAPKATHGDEAVPLAGHVSSEKPPSLKPMDEHRDQVAKEEHPAQAHLSAPPSHPRLGSPFEPYKAHTVTDEEPSWAGVLKVSDSPPIVRSPVQRDNHTPRRHSPEVRILSKTPQSPRSISNEHAGANESLNQPAPHSPSLDKRRRQDDDSDLTGLPRAKRSLFSPSQHQNQDGILGTKVSPPPSREGSARNMPIEIEDSQEKEVVGFEKLRHLQPSSLAPRKPSPHSQRPTQTLRDSPSLEEIPRPSSRFASREHQPHGGFTGGRLEMESSADGGYTSEHGRRSRVPSPSLRRTGKKVGNLVDAISQSTDQMQLDESQSSIVRETPEPGRRSPAS